MQHLLIVPKRWSKQAEELHTLNILLTIIYKKDLFARRHKLTLSCKLIQASIQSKDMCLEEVILFIHSFRKQFRFQYSEFEPNTYGCVSLVE